MISRGKITFFIPYPHVWKEKLNLFILKIPHKLTISFNNLINLFAFTFFHLKSHNNPLEFPLILNLSAPHFHNFLHLPHKCTTKLSLFILMDNLNIETFKCILITLFFLFFLMIPHTASSSSPSSSHSSNNNQEIQSQNPSSTNTELSHYHQVFYLKNTDPPMFLSIQERIKKLKMNRNKNKNMMKQKKHRKHKKKIVKNMVKSRPFSVMLPKGFVPPSGSSPCHNDQPNSVSFHCYLTSTEP